MFKYWSILLTFIFSSSVFAQQQIFKLSPNQVEGRFLEENLQLIAEKLNVDIANAEISQAKLWDNPELSINSVNLWSSKAKREEAEINSFPKNTQFSVELSQLIQTANKRGKLVNREKVSKEIAIQDFEEVLRGLKIELRRTIGETIYQQSYMQVLSNQQQSLQQLIEAYQRQLARGNIAKTELLRLQSALLELKNEINEVRTGLNENQKELKVLLNMKPEDSLEIEGAAGRIVEPTGISLAYLLETAASSRPDVKRQNSQTQYFEKSLVYEKSMRVPDVTFSANYDRRGGIWKDFVGFGVSFDLPFFNRNQGNIKTARISRDQSQFLAQQQQNIARHEVASAFMNYTQTYDFYTSISNNELLSELDEMMEIYTKNLLNRNISMLEYIDFMDAYKTNKETLLTAKKKLAISFDELQYVIGTDIK